VARGVIKFQPSLFGKKGSKMPRVAKASIAAFGGGATIYKRPEIH
jgi:hypothetical protein